MFKAVGESEEIYMKVVIRNALDDKWHMILQYDYIFLV